MCLCVRTYVVRGRGQGQVSSLVNLHSCSPGVLSFSYTLASDPWHPPVSVSLHPKCLRAEAAICSFYVCGGDLNTGPHACMASPLPARPPPIPSVLFHFPVACSMLSAIVCPGRTKLTRNRSLLSHLSGSRDLGRFFSTPYSHFRHRVSSRVSSME